ncbi:MAG TPA: DUF1800 domain-containing protein [Chloroflexia bacterium]|nr:DUF1800 domain-containing protein [Chloroflexia bacterium]
MSDNPLSDRRVQAAHLLRRAGFGGTQAEIDQLAAMSHSDAVDKLLNFKYDGNLAFNLQRKLQENGYEANLNDIAYWWMLTMTHTRQPLQEKMALFWHGHFTSSFSKVRDPMLLLEQNELFRTNALSNFNDLVKKVSRNPAMIDFLDGEANRKGKPNENYARELMELFTIGIGNYTEQDVREAARAFTGWTYRDRAYVFTPALHDNGSKTFMGKTGNFNGDDIIDIILARRESGKFIITKLWNFFVYENPEPQVIDRLTDLYFSNNYSIKEVMRAILTSPEFLSPKAYRALVKSPVEYVVGMVKDLGMGNVESRIATAAAGMGQTLFNPPTVKGWDGGKSWINSSYFFDRINAANVLATSRNQNYQYDPYSLLGISDNNSQPPNTAAKLVDKFAAILLDGQAHPDVKTALSDYLGGNNFKPTDLLAAAANKPAGKQLDTKVRGTLHLIMSTPDYMLK